MIPLAEPDLAALTLLLWLAYPALADERKRAGAERKILAHWAANAGAPADGYRRRDRLRAGKSVICSARERVARAQAFWLPLNFAAGLPSLDEAPSGLRWSGSRSVNALARKIAAASNKKSADTIRARWWNQSAPIVHLAAAVHLAGGVDAALDPARADAAGLADLLADAESRRRLSAMIGLDVKNTIQFRPVQYP